MLDEVEQLGSGPLQILKEGHRQRSLRDELEEATPGGEELLALVGGVRRWVEEDAQAWFEPGSLIGVAHELRQRDPQPPPLHLTLLGLDDAGSAPDHLGQRGEGGALAVRRRP